MSMRKQNGVIRVQHDITRQPPLMKSALLFPPQTKMSKFANPEFLRCRVAVIFSSGGSIFFLGRQCFGAFMDALIGCWFCKNFYKFSLFFCLFFRLIICICFAFCLASKWWAKGRKCGVEAKKGWI